MVQYEDSKKISQALVSTVIVIIICAMMIIIVPNGFVKFLAGGIIAVAITFIGLLMRRLKKLRKKEEDFEQIDMDGLVENIENEVDDSGLDSDEFIKGAFGEDPPSAAPSSSPSEPLSSSDEPELPSENLYACPYGKTDDGPCPEGFVPGVMNPNSGLHDTCCVLPADTTSPPAGVTIALEMGLEILKAVTVDALIKLMPYILKWLSGEFSDEAIDRAMREGMQELGGKKLNKTIGRALKKLNSFTRTASRAGRSAAKSMARVSALTMQATVRATIMQVPLGTTGRVAASFAQAAASSTATTRLAVRQLSRQLGKNMGKLAAKIAAKASTMMFKLSNPIGWALFALDLMSIGLDLADPSGYNNYTEASVIEDFFKAAHLENEKSALITGTRVPTLFPISVAFPEEFRSAISAVVRDGENTLLDRLLAEDNDANADMLVNLLLYMIDPDILDKDDFESLMTEIMAEVNKDPIKRDEKIYKAMVNHHAGTSTAPSASPVNLLADVDTKNAASQSIMDKIQLYPSQSGVSTYGVSLSVNGVKWWNEKNKAEWFRNNDVFDTDIQPPNTIGQIWNDVGQVQPNGIELTNALLSDSLFYKNRFSVDELIEFGIVDRATRQSRIDSSTYIKVRNNYWKAIEYVAPPVCLYTNQYYVLDMDNPGTSDKPNSILKYINNDINSERLPISIPAGRAVTFCEKFRNAPFMGGVFGKNIDDANAGIDPKHHCVKFDDGTGETGVPGCIYTDAWCTRMGMKHRYNAATGKSDCYKDEGQEVSEFLFGATITRSYARGFHEFTGSMCNPCCKVQEYCENNTCKPKHELGYHVGSNNRHKCLSGQEAFGKCVECRDGRAGSFMCNGNANTKNGHDCSNDACYCDDEWGSSTFDTCVPKKNVGVHVGVGADYKCKTGKEAFGSCVTCRDGRNSTDCKSDEYCEDAWGNSEFDKCTKKKSLNETVPGTGERGYKCKSGLEAHGKCVQCKDGKNGAHHCNNKIGIDTLNIISLGSDGKKRCGRDGDCYCEDDNGRNHDKCVFKKKLGSHVGPFGDYKCKSRLEAHGKCVQCKDGSSGGHHCNGERGIEKEPSNFNDAKGNKRTVCGTDDCYCEDDGGTNHDKCVFKRSIGKQVGHTAAYKCLSGHDAHTYCVECKNGNNDHCLVKYPNGTHYCEAIAGGGGNDNTCQPKKEVGANVGWNNGRKCLSGQETNGICYNGNGSVPLGKNVGAGNGRYCVSGIEVLGICTQCKDQNTGCNADAQYCETGVCVPKKEIGEFVGPFNDYKCISGLEAGQHCVQCRDGRTGAHHCSGKSGIEKDSLNRSRCGTGINSCYCEDDNGTNHDKCVFKRPLEKHVGPTAGYKCISGVEAGFKCVQCKEGNADYCTGKNAIDLDGKGRTTCGTDPANPENSCYCENNFSTNHDKCVFKRPSGINVGPTAKYKCISNLEANSRCVECKHGANHETAFDGEGRCSRITKSEKENFDCTSGGCYCEDDNGTNHDYCIKKKSNGYRAGIGAGRKCESNKVCNERCQSVGSIRNGVSAGHCGAEYCQSGRKKNMAMECAECNNDPDCNDPDNKFCKDNTCHDKRIDGQNCSGDKQCKSNKCHWGKCRTPQDCVGSWSDCQGPCNNRHKVYNITTTKAYDGASCSHSNGSKNYNACSNNCELGTICSNDSECESGWCAKVNNNARNKTCRSLTQEGHWCNDDKMCVGKYCHHNHCSLTTQNRMRECNQNSPCDNGYVCHWNKCIRHPNRRGTTMYQRKNGHF